MEIINAFQQFRTILCVCPNCNQIKRLSDLKIKYKGETPNTWLDTYNTKLRKIEKKIEKFDQQEKEIREKARQEGRKLAIQQTQQTLQSCIAQCQYNPRDIKSILHPIDFIVFDGLDQNDQTDQIIFLTRKQKNPTLTTLRKAIQKTIQTQNYNWQLLRIQDDGKLEIE